MLGAVRSILQKWQLLKQIERIYIVCIRPIITYGVTVSYPRTKEGQRTLERVNRIAAEMPLNRYGQSYEDSLNELKWDNIRWISVKDQMRMMFTFVLRVENRHEEGEITRIDLIEPDLSRHSQRLTHDKPFKVKGNPPHLKRTTETAIQRMVSLWNRLPTSIIHCPFNQFMNALSESDTKSMLLHE